MSKRPIIAVDLDDVLAESTEFWRGEVNSRTGLSLEPEHWRIPGEYSGYYTRIWESHGISHLFSIEDIDAYMKRDQSKICPVSTAPEVLRKLAKTFEIIVVTARNGNQEAATRKWLQEQYPDPGTFDKIFFTYRPDGKKVSKGEICAEAGASWLIDDSPSHCNDALQNGVQSILYGEYGWHVNVPMGVVRCKSWEEIGNYFDEQRSR